MAQRVESKMKLRASGILVLFSVFLLTGCGDDQAVDSSVPVEAEMAQPSTDETSTAAMIEKARALYEEAELKEHAWLVTSRSIDAATQALADNDDEAARVAAKLAIFTAQASLQQAETEAMSWKSRVPK